MQLTIIPLPLTALTIDVSACLFIIAAVVMSVAINYITHQPIHFMGLSTWA